MKVKYIVGILSLLMAILFVRSCLIPSVRHFSEINMTAEERKVKLTRAVAEYMKIFKDSNSNDFAYHGNFISKSQNPILTFVYKPDPKMRGHDYWIVMQKINMTNPLSLDKFVILKEGAAKTSDITAGSEANGINFRFSRQHDSLSENIYITYEDSLLHKTFLKDSFLNYNFQTKEINICSELDDKLIMGFESTLHEQQNIFPKYSKVALNISILKKDNSIFIIAIYPRATDFKMNSQVLRDLFNIKIDTNW
jgi:hypothetical protein